MSNTLIIVLAAVMVVATSTILYKKFPFKKHEGTKPKLTLFPKYVADYHQPLEDIEYSLAVLGFKGTADPTFYYRGKVYGNFAAKSIKLSVQINEEESQIKVQASHLGILFDLGAIWQVTSDILNEPKPEPSDVIKA